MRKHRSILVSLAALLIFACLPPVVRAWEREPLSMFAERRSKLMAAINAPVVLFGYTGHEEANPSYVFMQEENFYYLTGHNEEGAALLLVPDSAAEKGWSGAREILYLPPRDMAEERWNGPRMGPDDPGIQEKTGFVRVETFGKLHDALVALAKNYPDIYTALPGPHDEGYPHAANWSKWVKDAVPQAAVKDVSSAVGTLRAIKSSGELALIQKAIDPSIDAHLAAMKMVRPGLYEYQVAAKMVEIHEFAGAKPRRTRPLSEQASTPRYFITTNSIAGSRTAISCCSTLPGNFPDMRRTSRARFRPTENSRRGSAKFTKLFWGRKMPRWRPSSPA